MAKESKNAEQTKPEKVKSEKAKSDKQPKQKGPNKVVKFFKDLKAEAGKIVWPAKATVINNTGVVLTVMVVVGIFIWGFDFGLSKLLDLIIG